MPGKQIPELLRMSPKEKTFFDTGKLIKPHRRKLLVALLEQDETLQGDSIDDAVKRWELDEQRFVIVLARSIKMSRGTLGNQTIDSIYRQLPVNLKISFCKGVRSLQEFTDITLRDQPDCRPFHRQRLDLAILNAARENFRNMMENRGKDRIEFYSLPTAAAALLYPQRIIELAYPSFVNAGIWSGQARVLCGLSEFIHETPNSIDGKEWVDEDFDAQVDRYLEVQEQEDLKEAEFTKRLNGIASRKHTTTPPRLYLD